jgi:hypothetical protein
MAAEVVVALLIRVIDEIPLFFVGAGDEGGVAAGPPFFAPRGGADDRVVRRIFPRAAQVARARHDDHVAGGGAGGAALGQDHVVVVAAAQDLGAFLREGFDVPLLGIRPAVVDLFRGAGDGEAVVGEREEVARAHEEVAPAVFVHGVAGVDMADLEVDGIAPWAGGGLGVHDHVGEFVAVERGEVDVVASCVLAEIGSPDGADISVEGRAEGAPVHEIPRMPDEEAGGALEGGVDQIVVATFLEHGGIGIIAGEDGIEEGAVAEVGLALRGSGHVGLEGMMRGGGRAGAGRDAFAGVVFIWRVRRRRCLGRGSRRKRGRRRGGRRRGR